MADVKVKKAKLTDLIPDDRNLNKGTERGKELIARSINQFGAVRGIAVDKDNRIIAGNKTVENAIEQGIEDVIIVETTGKELVVTKRTDTSLDTKQGREMALADNATVKVDLEWNTDEINAISDDYGIDVEEWDVEDNTSSIQAKDKDDIEIKYEYKIEISCRDEHEQELLYNEMIKKGYACRILTL